jgi:hypothetical protein
MVLYIIRMNGSLATMGLAPDTTRAQGIADWISNNGFPSAVYDDETITPAEQALVDAAAAVQLTNEEAEATVAFTAEAKSYTRNHRGPDARVKRAVLNLIRKGFNVLRKRDRDRNAALQSGATLGAIKLAWNAMPVLDDFSWNEILAMLDIEIDGNV